MQFILLTPEKKLFDGDVESVTIPGTKGLFTVLPQHAPLLTTVGKGLLTYRTGDSEMSINVEDGFADVKNNVITVCIEKTAIHES
jgi:F-type H+-transporting ATPase subunit epsilon